MASRLKNIAVAIGCTLVVALAVSVVPAQAARIHQLELSETLPEEETPFGVAVDQAAHHFYVASFGIGGATRRVIRYEANGQVDIANPELTGAPSLDPLRVGVDNSGGAERGYIYASGSSGVVQQFDTSGKATLVTINEASIPPNETPQEGGLPPVVNNGTFEPKAVAVGPSGTVFVADAGARLASAHAIDEFTPAGDFVAQFAAGNVKVGTGGIVIDATGHIYIASNEANGFGKGLFELNSSGECVTVGCAPIDPDPINGVALDEADGKIFTTGQVGPEEGVFSEYEASTGTLLGVTRSSQLHEPRGIAVEEASGEVIVADAMPSREGTIQIYGPAVEVPTPVTGAPEGITDHSATLTGTIKPEGAPASTCYFQYVNSEEFVEHRFEGADTVACEPGGPFTGSGEDAVHADVEGLQGGTVYHERLVAENEPTPGRIATNPGEADEFATFGPTVSDSEANEISETTATLTGDINPRGLVGSYVLQYLTQASFEAGGWGSADEIPVGGGQIPLAGRGSADLRTGPSAAGEGSLHSGPSAAGSGALTSGSAEVASLSTTEGAFEIGEAITGEGIPAGTNIAEVKPGALVLSAKATASGSGITLTAGSLVIASLSTTEGAFEIGEAITGEGIPAGTTIVEIGSGALVLSAPALISGHVALAAGARVVSSLDTTEGAFRVGQTVTGPGIPVDAKVIGISPDGTELGLSTPADQTLAGAPLTASAPLTVAETVQGLTPRTFYRFRILATTAGGVIAGHTEAEGVAFSTFSPAPSFGGCPNEAFRLGRPSGALPDCRAYEQVSPVDKNGANVQGALNAVQASPDGDRITFFVNTGIPGGEGEQDFPTYLATRAADGTRWSTQGLLPPPSFGPTAEVMGWNEDLRDVYDFAAEAGSAQLLRRSSVDRSLTEVGKMKADKVGAATFAGSSQAGEVALLESKVGGLVAGDLTGKQNLYVYDRETGGLAVAGVLNPVTPGGKPVVPPGGAMAGAYPWTGGSTSAAGGAFGHLYTQAKRAISADGKRIFFTAGETGQIYVRENPLAPQSAMSGEQCTEAGKACTIRISAPEEGVADPGTPAGFLGASADGSVAFFLDRGKLTEDATGGGGYDLYRYDLRTGKLSDLTLDAADIRGARVEGALGISETGEEIYFVARGALAEDAGEAPFGETNLYVLEGTEIHLIARLGTSPSEALNWTPSSGFGSASTTNTARLSADGRALLFRSARRLTAYRNHGVLELYLYRSGQGINCVSCNPSGQAPAGLAGVQEIPVVPFHLNRSYAIMTHNLSADGRRVIFDSADRLLSADENNVNDVYEWELPGKGNCTAGSSAYDRSSGGCLFLISTGGKEAGPSWFGGADEEGDNAFFFTSQPLVARDKDELVDVYDARVGGGITAQEQGPPPVCRGEGECMERAGGGPVTSSPQSPGASGANVISRHCKKGFVRRHGKCVRRHKRHHRIRRYHHSRHGKGSHHGKGKKRHDRGARKGGGR